MNSVQPCGQAPSLDFLCKPFHECNLGDKESGSTLVICRCRKSATPRNKPNRVFWEISPHGVNGTPATGGSLAEIYSTTLEALLRASTGPSSTREYLMD